LAVCNSYKVNEGTLPVNAASGNTGINLLAATYLITQREKYQAFLKKYRELNCIMEKMGWFCILFFTA
jgi:predicted PolB exonuclease-like 3'-5' exonuclease